ncbi:uncharacterized mitochondrial protein AtMg00810-like [Lactuca sativa]|uniref:uncharacterized mitochondrial protein AtMg00810-like n=1 Tax=Lactuca sativa TaxID=4236 RepID=UPI0022B00581|nr:uncharacterized mitochondrial protein AtMg00810-like [Lactuca sativa]
MGLLSYYLGIEVSQELRGISLKQEGYARKLLEKAGLLDCNPIETPMENNLELTKDESGKPVDATEYRSIVGGLRYLCHTRPDISYVVGVVSRFLERPTEQHNQAVKRILRYIKGTLNLGLVYTRSKEKKHIIAYSDSNHARDVNDRRSTSGMVFYLNKNLVTWSSQKQQCVALSSCEAEFMAANLATCQGIWVRRLVQEITGEKLGPVTILIDNKSTLELVKHPVFHGRSKHIDTRFHFIRNCIECGDVIAKFVASMEQQADILTKPLAKNKFKEMRNMLGMKCWIRKLSKGHVGHFPVSLGSSNQVVSCFHISSLLVA